MGSLQVYALALIRAAIFRLKIAFEVTNLRNYESLNFKVSFLLFWSCWLLRVFTLIRSQAPETCFEHNSHKKFDKRWLTSAESGSWQFHNFVFGVSCSWCRSWRRVRTCTGLVLHERTWKTANFEIRKFEILCSKTIWLQMQFWDGIWLLTWAPWHTRVENTFLY